jgi:uncharacterized protein (TIGR02246 family)
MSLKLAVVVVVAVILPSLAQPRSRQTSDKPSLHTSASSDEEALRDLDTQWSKALEDKDAAKAASFYSETGAALPFNAPIVIGRDNIREFWTNLMAKPGFSLHFSPTHIEIARSGEMAYDTGVFELKMNNDQGQSATIPGKYVVVWKKQASGKWQAELDIFNPDK